jgi:hypothetical protein
MTRLQYLTEDKRSAWYERQRAYASLFDHPDAITFTIKVEPPAQARNKAQPLYRNSRQFSRELFRAIDEAAFGRRFYKRPSLDRALGCLVPEALDWYPHYHGILVPPKSDATQPAKIMSVIDNAAKRLCYETTTTWNRELTTPTGMFIYMMKENNIHKFEGNFSFDFHR